jgi:hypothetical protein
MFFYKHFFYCNQFLLRNKNHFTDLLHLQLYHSWLLILKFEILNYYNLQDILLPLNVREMVENFSNYSL